MKGLLEFLKANKTGVSILGVVLAGFIVMAGMNGCQLTDLVSVKVPRAVQNATNSPPKITLTEAPEVMQAYIREGERFKENIAQGYKWLGFLASLSNTGIEMGKSMIPGGAIGLSLLTLAGGIFIKGPGTAKEKNDSYNKGLKEGERIASTVMALAELAQKPPVA